MSTQKMLEEALIYFGAEEQKMIYEAYKEANNVFTICN